MERNRYFGIIFQKGEALEFVESNDIKAIYKALLFKARTYDNYCRMYDRITGKFLIELGNKASEPNGNYLCNVVNSWMGR